MTMLVVAIGVTVGALSGASVAWALFSGGSATQTNSFAADTLPTGSTPSGSVSPANSPTVNITFQTTNTVGGTQVTFYAVTRYNASTEASAGSISGSCSVVSTTVSCTDTPGNGSWEYTDTPRYDNWLGTESADSGTVTVDTTSPTASAPIVAATVTYGTNPIWVNHENVTLTDSPTDVGGTVASVAYYYCPTSAGSCTSSTPWTSIGSSSTGPNWSVTWSSSSLPPDGTYNVVAVATGTNTSVSSPSSPTEVGVDSTPPTVSPPSVNGYSG